MARLRRPWRVVKRMGAGVSLLIAVGWAVSVMWVIWYTRPDPNGVINQTLQGPTRPAFLFGLDHGIIRVLHWPS